MSVQHLLLLILTCILGAAGCGHSNNLLLGEVRGWMGTHEILVTDCYRTRVPQPTASEMTFRWEPCRDAVIAIENERLKVNGKDYGHLNDRDSVAVDHGVVSVSRNGIAARADN
jgi:hypothetical protein